MNKWLFDEFLAIEQFLLNTLWWERKGKEEIFFWNITKREIKLIKKKVKKEFIKFLACYCQDWLHYFFNLSLTSQEKKKYSQTNIVCQPNYIYFLFLFVLFVEMSTQRISFLQIHLFTENAVDIRRQLSRLNEQSQGRGSEKLTKRQCQALYPDGKNRVLFLEIEEKLGSLNKTETLLFLYKYDFSLACSIAEEATSPFHCNMKPFKSLYEKFDKNANRVMDCLRKFKEHQPHNEKKTVQSSTWNNFFIQKIEARKASMHSIVQWCNCDLVVFINLSKRCYQRK